MSYINADRETILRRALQLDEMTLRNFYGSKSTQALTDLQIHPKDKGKLGNLIEVLHFGLTLNSRPGPDFIAAEIELKTSGLKTLQTGELVAKERLPLGMIDYMSFQNPAYWDFDTAGVLQKCRLMLLMIYLYESNVEIVDLLFKLIDLWEFPATDLEIIRRDWEFIVEKIKQGKAHELSEGDTLYLGASTAGSGHGRTRPQPFNDLEAKPRKFSLKQSYLDHVIAILSVKRGRKYGRILTGPKDVKSETSLEEIVVGKFKRFYGMNVDEIMDALGVRLNTSAKHFAAQLTKAVLNIELNKVIEEFDKAGIISRTVRLEPSDLPEQSVSFPAFEFKELIKETWEESEFRSRLDSKFFFVFFQYDRPKWLDGKRVKGRKLTLKTVRFWNMPEADIEEARDVWESTVTLVKEGRIVRGFKKNGDRITFFPGINDNRVSHVRPHGKDRDDTYPLPVPDVHTGWRDYTKQCFWINNSYIRDSVYYEQKAAC